MIEIQQIFALKQSTQCNRAGFFEPVHIHCSGEQPMTEYVQTSALNTPLLRCRHVILILRNMSTMRDIHAMPHPKPLPLVFILLFSMALGLRCPNREARTSYWLFSPLSPWYVSSIRRIFDRTNLGIYTSSRAKYQFSHRSLCAYHIRVHRRCRLVMEWARVVLCFSKANICD